MRPKTSFHCTLTSSMAVLMATLSLFAAGQVWAAGAIAKGGGAIQIDSVTYKLDGIDVPELDQTCIDDHADPWACGIEAQDRLSALIGGHEVRCEPSASAPLRKKWRTGICTVVGENNSLNLLMVREGFGLASDPSGKNRLKDEQTAATEKQRGLWKGCFVAPQEFRQSRKDGALLGGACTADKDREIRSALFPADWPMPPGCSIKATLAVRARITGNVGVYHLQGCRSYPGLTRPDRWFCSEQEAQVAGFRKAYNCRTGRRS